MANSPFDANPAFTKLGDDTRKAVTQAFDAMSNWRSELAELGEKNSNAVFDKMAEAAKSLGWPTDFVELSRKQMQNASKLQLQAVDQVMDVWEKQVKSIGSTSQLPNFPNFPGFGNVTPGQSGFPGGVFRACPISVRAQPIRSSFGCRPQRCGRRAGSRRCRPGSTLSRTPSASRAVAESPARVNLSRSKAVTSFIRRPSQDGRRFRVCAHYAGCDCAARQHCLPYL